MCRGPLEEEVGGVCLFECVCERMPVSYLNGPDTGQRLTRA